MSFRNMTMRMTWEPAGTPGRLVLAQDGQNFLVGRKATDPAELPVAGFWVNPGIEGSVVAEITGIYFDHDELWSRTFERRFEPEHPH